MKQISISQEPHEIWESCKDQSLQFQMFFQTKY